jgi:two-component sensor histidine kinase
MTAAPTPTHPDVALNLALAMVASSNAPLLLLDGALEVIAASGSFCRAFAINPDQTAGRPVFALGQGEWDSPRLRSLLTATLSGQARIDAYEMDLPRQGAEPRRLVLNAQKLDYGDDEAVRVLLTVSDVTDARAAEKLKDDLLREKAVLLQEVQHRVANSLQIIASVLLQSARNVQSEDVKAHLQDAHHRVMSIAAVQRQLATSTAGEVELRPYFIQLCQSLGASMIRDPNQISLKVTVDGSKVDADTSVSLGLVVTELVINALKHAFPGHRSGKILVGYLSNGPNWTLSVSDNGIGMPVASVPQAKAGLGTSIIEALAKQLHAQVQVANASPGTKISLVHAQVYAVGSDASAATGQTAV